MRVTATIKNADKNEVLDKCFLGFEYEQVGNDVTILYFTKADAVDDLCTWNGEYTIEKGWDFIDLVTGKPCKNLNNIG